MVFSWRLHMPLQVIFLTLTVAQELFELLPIEDNDLNIFIYGGVLDLLFRYGRIFPSLDGYYEALPIWLSFIYGGLPFLIPRYLF
jgi:hypothetical protein